jgi:hypothetical protein
MKPVPDLDAFEERAAIAEYVGGLSREAAEDLAAQAQGFQDRFDYWKALADYVINRDGSAKPN